MQQIHLPTLGARYWAALCLASIFGANMGDFCAHNLGLGHIAGLPFLALALAIVILAERFDRSVHQVYYWTAIIIVRTAATNFADFAAGDPARRIEQADDCEPGERFARAGLADDAENLARRDVERDAVERHQRPLAGGEFDPEIANRKQRPGHFSLGLSASRNQSPSKFTASTRAASVRLGKATIHHSPENR